jgi:hypothetical protein
MFGFQINSKGEQVLCQQALRAKPYAFGVEKHSALRVTTRHASQGLNHLLDGLLLFLKPKLQKCL